MTGEMWKNKSPFRFAVKIYPVSQVIGMLQDLPHQVTADAGADVKTFAAYAEWFEDQALDDGHQQENLDANVASTNAAIEKFAAKADSASAVQALHWTWRHEATGVWCNILPRIWECLCRRCGNRSKPKYRLP